MHCPRCRQTPGRYARLPVRVHPGGGGGAYCLSGAAAGQLLHWEEACGGRQGRRGPQAPCGQQGRGGLEGGGAVPEGRARESRRDGSQPGDERLSGAARTLGDWTEASGLVFISQIRLARAARAPRSGSLPITGFRGEVVGGNHVIPKQTCGEVKLEVTGRPHQAPSLLSSPVPAAGLKDLESQAPGTFCGRWGWGQPCIRFALWACLPHPPPPCCPIPPSSVWGQSSLPSPLEGLE